MGIHVNYPLFLSDFNQTSIFLNRFFKIPQKSTQWETSYSMRTDGPTDNTNLMVFFHNFANTPKNGVLLTLFITLQTSIA